MQLNNSIFDSSDHKTQDQDSSWLSRWDFEDAKWWLPSCSAPKDSISIQYPLDYLLWDVVITLVSILQGCLGGNPRTVFHLSHCQPCHFRYHLTSYHVGFFFYRCPWNSKNFYPNLLNIWILLLSGFPCSIFIELNVAEVFLNSSNIDLLSVLLLQHIKITCSIISFSP